MAKCSVCDEETQLHVNGRPLCALCDLDHTQHRRATVEVLWEKVKASKSEYGNLSNKFDRLNMEVLQGGHGVPYPDSTHRIEALGDQTRAAFQKYQRAMELYIEALKRS
jgi:hypothetical protein